MAAQYRLLAPHYVNNVYYEANTIVTAGKEVPLGWPPTSACDPLNQEGINALWALGPREMIAANAPAAAGDYGIRSRWTDVPVTPAAVRWVPAHSGPNPNNEFVLTGPGSTLGKRQAF
jgi:hypothetical protein